MDREFILKEYKRNRKIGLSRREALNDAYAFDFARWRSIRDLHASISISMVGISCNSHTV